jgi:hypothetical protein
VRGEGPFGRVRERENAAGKLLGRLRPEKAGLGSRMATEIIGEFRRPSVCRTASLARRCRHKKGLTSDSSTARVLVGDGSPLTGGDGLKS